MFDLHTNTIIRPDKIYQQVGHASYGRRNLHNNLNPDSELSQMSAPDAKTETVQMNPYEAGPFIQMVPGDKHDITSTGLADDPKLEKVFDAEAIVKIPHQGEHVRKIQQALIDLDINLPIFGADSLYGTETRNAVIEFQQKAGMSAPEWDGIVGRKTLGLLDKSLRNGFIETDPDLEENDFTVFDPDEKDTSCETKDKVKTCTGEFLDQIDSSIDESVKIVDKVLNQQLPPQQSNKADYSAIYTTLFRNNDQRPLASSVQDVRNNFIKTKTFMNAMKWDRNLIRCATECDGGCRSGSPAYHSPDRETGRPHVITFCPGLNAHKDKLLIMIHESHHAAVSGSRDFAYPSERLIKLLDFSKAILNAASYHLYASAVDNPSALQFGQKVEDKNTISDVGNKNKVNQVLAFIEHWFSLNTFDISQTIQGAREAKNTGSYDPENHHNTIILMEDVFSKWFGLTKPPAAPTEEDIIKLTAIEERLKTMEKTFEKPFAISETAGPGDWNNIPPITITLNPQTISLSQIDLATALLQELVNATPHISAESEPLYVGTINDMRNKRNLDP